MCGRTDGCVAVVKGRRSVARITVTALLVCHWTDTSHLTLTSAAATRARTLDTDHAPTADISHDDDDDDASQPLRCRLVELTNYFQLTILSMCITQRPWGRCLQVKYRYLTDTDVCLKQSAIRQWLQVGRRSALIPIMRVGSVQFWATLRSHKTFLWPSLCLVTMFSTSQLFCGLLTLSLPLPRSCRCCRCWREGVNTAAYMRITIRHSAAELDPCIKNYLWRFDLLA